MALLSDTPTRGGGFERKTSLATVGSSLSPLSTTAAVQPSWALGRDEAQEEFFPGDREALDALGFNGDNVSIECGAGTVWDPLTSTCVLSDGYTPKGMSRLGWLLALGALSGAAVLAVAVTRKPRP